MPQRLVLAAVLAGLPLLWPPLHTDLLLPFAAAVPLIVLAGGHIRSRLAEHDLRVDVALAALSATPALCAWSWRVVFLDMEAGRLDPHQELIATLGACARCVEPSAPMLACAGLAMVVLLPSAHRFLGATLVGSGLGALVGSTAWSACRQAITHGEVGLWSARTGAWAWVLGPVLGLLFWQGARGLGRPSPQQGGLLLLFALCASVPSWVPVPRFIDRLAVPATKLLVPTGAPGPSTSAEAVRGTPADVASALAALDLRPDMHLEGQCRQPSQLSWHRSLRSTLAVAVPAAEHASLVADVARTMLEFGYTRLALVGRAVAPAGPLGDHLAWPTASVLLDRPPRDALWGRLEPGTLVWEGPEPDGDDICALLVSPRLTVAELYDRVRSLAGPGPAPPCPDAVALAFTEPATGHSLSSLSCAFDRGPANPQ